MSQYTQPSNTLETSQNTLATFTISYKWARNTQLVPRNQPEHTSNISHLQ